MTHFSRFRYLYIFVVMVLLIGGVVGIKSFSNPRNSAENSSASWSRYTSTKAGISFDYPKGWGIEDSIIGGSDGAPTAPAVNSLWASYPVDAAKYKTPPGYEFYTKTRIQYPVVQQEVDETGMFSRFSEYLKPGKNFHNVRIIIGNEALYREGEYYLGIAQVGCQKSADQCSSDLNHVLDSISVATSTLERAYLQ